MCPRTIPQLLFLTVLLGVSEPGVWSMLPTSTGIISASLLLLRQQLNGHREELRAITVQYIIVLKGVLIELVHSQLLQTFMELSVITVSDWVSD